MLGALLVMNNATSEAARQATVYRNGFSEADYINLARTALNRSLPKYVGNFKLNVVPTVSSFACGDSTCLRLQVVYPNYSNNPLVGNAFIIPLPQRLTAESTTRVEPNNG